MFNLKNKLQKVVNRAPFIEYAPMSVATTWLEKEAERMLRSEGLVRSEAYPSGYACQHIDSYVDFLVEVGDAILRVRKVDGRMYNGDPLQFTEDRIDICWYGHKGVIAAAQEVELILSSEGYEVRVRTSLGRKRSYYLDEREAREAYQEAL